MWIRALINFEEAANTAVGVNITLTNTGDTFSFCVLKKQKNEVILVKAAEGIRDAGQLMVELIPYVIENVRVHVNFDGRGLLSKELVKQESLSETRLFSFFPGIKKDDFILQGYTGSEVTFCSLLRRETAENHEVVKRYPKNIVSFSLSKYIVSVLRPFYQTSNILLLNDAQVLFTGASIQKLEAAPGSPMMIVIGGQDISTGCVVAYASALSIFAAPDDFQISNIQSAEQATNLFDAKGSIYKTSRMAMLGLLTILVVNAVLFFNFKENVSQLEATISRQEQSSTEEDDLVESTQKIAVVYERLGWKNNSLPIFYADQLATVLPGDIELSNLEIGVMDGENLRKSKRYLFQPNRIKVKGTSQTPSSVNSLFAAIGKLPWVERVEDHKYQYDRKLKLGLFEFTIIVK